MKSLINKNPKVLVIGDLMIDYYLWGSSERISPEAPVQIIDINNETKTLGGAGNVVNNLKALGANVDIISVIGDCKISLEIKELLNSIDVDSSYLVKESGRISSKKTRIISSQQQVIRYDIECTDEISLESQKSVVSILNKIIKNYDILLLSDYGKGILTKNLSQSIIKLANKNKIKVLVDPKGHDYSKYCGAFLLTPNKKEASEATRINITDNESLKKALKKLKDQIKLNFSLITLSEEGIAVYDNSLRIYPTFSREVFDVTGAGDTIIAALGYALSGKLNLDESIRFANLAAGIVIGKVGSATVTLNEIIEYESSFGPSTSAKKIKHLTEIISLSEKFKSQRKRIVFTNGCFDLLHLGHIKYLEESKGYGDILIIGLNSDKSIKKIKGSDRPINNQTDRAHVIASLESVDYVTIFEEDDPYDLIKAIKPHTLVKGGDYKNKKVVGDNLVEELRIVKFHENKSTSKLITKIQSGKLS
jgi:D-beta-D-heptose 7-phosphate kinase / D-beta-D-heptose 1-phosphate adenosyltransferase